MYDIARMLVSEGASSFASSVPQPPIAIVPVDSLITLRARQQWAHWKARLDQAEAGPATAGDQMQDTVGAVTCDRAGRMAAGVSRCPAISPKFRPLKSIADFMISQPKRGTTAETSRTYRRGMSARIVGHTTAISLTLTLSQGRHVWCWVLGFPDQPTTPHGIY